LFAKVFIFEPNGIEAASRTTIDFIENFKKLSFRNNFNITIEICGDGLQSFVGKIQKQLFHSDIITTKTGYGICALVSLFVARMAIDNSRSLNKLDLFLMEQEPKIKLKKELYHFGYLLQAYASSEKFREDLTHNVNMIFNDDVLKQLNLRELNITYFHEVPIRVTVIKNHDSMSHHFP
jgi:hypothetical protein